MSGVYGADSGGGGDVAGVNIHRGARSTGDCSDLPGAHARGDVNVRGCLGRVGAKFGGECPRRAEGLFYGHLLQCRLEGNKAGRDTTDVVLCSYEMFWKETGNDEAARAMSSCLDYLRFRWSGDEQKCSILGVLASLARLPVGAQAEQKVRIGRISRSLLAAEKVSGMKNKLCDITDTISLQMTKPKKNTILCNGLGGDGTAVFRGTVSLNARDIISCDEPRLDLVSFDFTFTKAKDCRQVDVQVEDSENRMGLGNFAHIVDPSCAALRKQMCAKPSEETLSHFQNDLFGALVLPRNVPVGLDSTLSFPDIKWSSINSDSAPDPMGDFIDSGKIVTMRKAPALKRGDNESTTDRMVANAVLVDVNDFVEKSINSNGWSKLISPSICCNQTFGWEEQVPKSFITIPPQSVKGKAIQYLSHSLLATERGSAWFDQAIAPFRPTNASAVRCNECDLVIDCLHVLIGISSDTFNFMPARGMFSQLPRRLAGVSETTLTSLLRDFCYCGNLFLAIGHLCGHDIDGGPIGSMLKEKISMYLFQHQKDVYNLYQAAQSQGKTLLELHGELDGLLMRLDSLKNLFSVNTSNLSQGESLLGTVQLLEFFHARMLEAGITNFSVERQVLEVGMAPLVGEILSWLFHCADTSEHFQGRFLSLNNESERIMPKDWFVKTRDSPEIYSNLPYTLVLPKFFKSRTRAVNTIEQLVERIVRAGCMLRILRELSSGKRLFSICTDLKRVGVFFQKQYPVPISHQMVEQIIENTSRRKVAMLQDINNATIEAKRKIQLEKQRTRNEALDSLGAMRKHNAEINDKYHEEVMNRIRKLEEEKIQLYQQLKSAADDAVKLKQKRRKQAIDDDLQYKSRDATSTITEDERKQAEAFLYAKYKAMEEEQSLLLNKLTTEESVTIQALDEKMELIGSMLPTTLPEVRTSVKVNEPPGGTDSVNQHTVTERANIRVLQSPGGETKVSFGQTEPNQDIERPAIRVTQQPGGKSSIVFGDDVTSYERNPTGTETGLWDVSATRVSQAPGGTSTICLGDDDAKAALDERSSVRVSQGPGGNSSINLGHSTPVVPEPENGSNIPSPLGVPEELEISHCSDGTDAETEMMSTGNNNNERLVNTSAEIYDGNQELLTGDEASGSTKLQSIGFVEGKKLTIQKREIDLEEAPNDDPVTECTEEVFNIIANTGPASNEIGLGDRLGKLLEECNEPPKQEECNEPHLQDCVPFDVALEVGLVEPILDQCMFVDAAMVSILKTQCGLFDHLEAMKRFYLMGQGDLFENIVHRLCDVDLPRTAFAESRGRLIHDILNSEMNAAGLDDCEYGRRFSYVVNPDVKGGTDFDFYAFDFFRAEYKLPWPLDLVILESDMELYQSIHRFLLRIKYAMILSNMIWGQLCQSKKVAFQAKEQRRLFSRLSLSWHQVRHLLGNFQGYILTQLFNNLWSEMMNSYHAGPKTFETPQHLHNIHREFVRKAQSYCFLDGTKSSQVIAQCLERIISSTVLLYKLTEKALDEAHTNGTGSFPTAAWSEFTRTQSFLVRTVKSFATHSIDKTNLGNNLLVHIDFNEYF